MTNSIRHLLVQLVIVHWDYNCKAVMFVLFHQVVLLMYKICCFLLVVFFSHVCPAQTYLNLKEALTLSLNNYGTIQSKANYSKSSNESIKQSKRDYLPNVVLSAQQDYGTVNGQNGPLYGYGGYAVASSGLPLPQQNWNAAFGALYLANVNWEVITFGRAKGKINVARRTYERDISDLEQEQFQHQVKVASAYLNLLAAQRITLAQEKNLSRALIFRNTAITRASSGLIAGVDSTFANAEVSSAKIALTNAKTREQEQASQLAVLIGIPTNDFVLDTTFISRIPLSVADTFSIKEKKHPLLHYYQSRIELSNKQKSYFTKLYYPSVSLFGVFQDRGSGFSAGYTQNQNAYTQDYITGVSPSRANYLLGVGVYWNLTTLLRNNAQVKSQQFISDAMKNEYDLVDQQLKAQRMLAEQKMENALNNYREVPVQLKSASEAYRQKNTLYKNGLTTLVEVTQTLYILNRAETDRDIAYNNVWQALLLKALATGDLAIFLNEF